MGEGEREGESWERGRGRKRHTHRVAMKRNVAEKSPHHLPPTTHHNLPWTLEPSGFWPYLVASPELDEPVGAVAHRAVHPGLSSDVEDLDGLPLVLPPAGEEEDWKGMQAHT
jgi:hypothetical protein